MNTMPISQTFPLRNEDIHFLDLQYDNGKVGLVTAVRVPLAALDAILEGNRQQNGAERAHRFAALCAQLNLITAMPNIFLDAHDKFDFTNPYSTDNVDTFINAELMDNFSDTLTETYEELEGRRDVSIIVLAVNTMHTNRQGQYGAFLMNVYAIKGAEITADEGFYLGMYQAATNMLNEQNLLEGTSVKLTGTYRLSDTPQTMNLSPLHSTDYREYKTLIDPEGTELDRNFTDVDSALPELVAMLSDPLAAMDEQLGKGTDEHREFIFDFGRHVVKELMEGKEVPPSLVMGVAERFYENEKDRLPEEIKNPLPVFLHEIMGMAKDIKHVYGIQRKDAEDENIFLFSSAPMSMLATLAVTENDTLRLPGGQYLRANAGDMQMFVRNAKDVKAMNQQDFVLPLDEFHGIADVTEMFERMIRHSFLLSLISQDIIKPDSEQEPENDIKH